MTEPRLPAGGVAVHCERVEVDLGDTEIVRRVSLDISAGTFVGLVGPNGSGKTTLLRAIYRSLCPRAGFITVDEADVWKLAPNDAAKRTTGPRRIPLKDSTTRSSSWPGGDGPNTAP